jgi:hypothetical protein
MSESETMEVTPMTTRMILPLLLLFLAPVLSAAEALTPAKKSAIMELMEVTGATQMKNQFGDVYVKQVQAMFTAANPNLPPRAQEVIGQEVRAVLDTRLDGDHGLFATVYPIYHQHFTLAEIQAMVAFYRTPAGKKAIKVMPQVTMQSIQATQRWAQSVAQAVQIRVDQRLAAEGLR